MTKTGKGGRALLGYKGRRGADHLDLFVFQCGKRSIGVHMVIHYLFHCKDMNKAKKRLQSGLYGSFSLRSGHGTEEGELRKRGGVEKGQVTRTKNK